MEGCARAGTQRGGGPRGGLVARGGSGAFDMRRFHICSKQWMTILESRVSCQNRNGLGISISCLCLCECESCCPTILMRGAERSAYP